MIVMEENGGRTVKLFIPFEFNGRKIDRISLAPMRFGHTLRWTAGDWKQSLDLLVELAGVEEPIIRELRYPDADRVMEAFLAMLPPEIRQDIAEGNIPQKRGEAPQPDGVVTNGSGAPVETPAAPLPEPVETGFDLSDEP